MDVLMVMWDGGGNVPPVLGIGRELAGRGHRVRCLAPERLADAIRRHGLSFRPTKHALAFDPTEPLPIEESQRRQGEVFLGEGYVRDIEAEVGGDRPDLVVIDCFLASSQATAETLKLPSAVLVHTLPGWFVPFWDETLLRPMNLMRQRSGLEPVASVTDMWAHASGVLVTSTRLLDVTLPRLETMSSLRYVGPVGQPSLQALVDLRGTADGSGLAERVVAGAEGSPPLVLVAFSTTAMGQEDALRRVVVALGSLPVRALVTVGPAVAAGALPQAPNVEVRDWVPHGSVLPHASLVITHAGHGSVMTALAHGVPLLCMPLGRDQEFIARRVEALGLGRRVPVDNAPDDIAAAASEVLRDPAYLAAATRAAQEIRAVGDGAVNAAGEFELMLR